MMLMSNDTSYKKLLTINVYSSIISVLGLLINIVLALILGGSGKELYTGLGPIFASSGGAVKVLQIALKYLQFGDLLLHG